MSVVLVVAGKLLMLTPFVCSEKLRLSEVMILFVALCGKRYQRVMQGFALQVMVVFASVLGAMIAFTEG